LQRLAALVVAPAVSKIRNGREAGRRKARGACSSNFRALVY
jgi:hypothetical protein